MAMRDLMKRSEPDILPSRFEPGSIFGSLQRQMNRLFEDFGRGWPLEEASGRFSPEIDVEETDDAVKVEADLPGMSDKDIEVTLSPDGESLTLRGERKYEHEEKGRGGFRRERAWGSFERSIGLPCAVEQDKVEAHFKNGVLTISMPKSPEAKQSAKKIPVKAD